MPINEWVPLDTDDYTVGQVTLTAGSSNITFKNAFNGAESSFYAGDSIYIPTAGKWLLLASITSRTTGTLLYPCPDDCAGTFDLRLRPLARNARQAGLAAMVLRNMQVGNLPALADLELKQGQVAVAGQVKGTFVAQNLPSQENLSDFMTKSVYDKEGKGADVYSMDNMDETDTAKIMTADERQAIAENTVATQDNTKAITKLKPDVDANTKVRLSPDIKGIVDGFTKGNDNNLLWNGKILDGSNYFIKDKMPITNGAMLDFSSLVEKGFTNIIISLNNIKISSYSGGAITCNAVISQNSGQSFITSGYAYGSPFWGSVFNEDRNSNASSIPILKYLHNSTSASAQIWISFSEFGTFIQSQWVGISGGTSIITGFTNAQHAANNINTIKINVSSDANFSSGGYLIKGF